MDTYRVEVAQAPWSLLRASEFLFVEFLATQ
jgi:hypothetical protein